MRHLLLAKGLWKYVDGTEVLAEDATKGVKRGVPEKVAKSIFYNCDGCKYTKIILGNIV